MKWPKVALKEVAEQIQYGYTASASSEPVGPKFLRITDIVPASIDWECVPYCKIDESDLAKYRLSVGDIVIARTGNTTGYAKLIRIDQLAVFASYLVRVRPNPRLVDPGFIGRLVESSIFKRFVNSQKSGSAQGNANAQVLTSFAFRLPPLSSQRRIVDILSAYDDLIENNTRRIKLVENAARLLYEEWFVRLRFPGYEHVKVKNGVPDGWERRSLANCARFLSGGTPSKAKAEYWDGEIPWISSGEMTELRLQDSSLHITQEGAEHGSRIVPPSTILVVVRGMSLAKEFRLAMTSKPVAFNQDLRALVCEPDVHPEYLFASLVAQRDQIRDQASDSSHGTKKLDTPVLAAVPVLLPTEQLQRAFCEIVARMNGLWDNCWVQNRKLCDARDLLLPRLMSGEVAV